MTRFDFWLSIELIAGAWIGQWQGARFVTAIAIGNLAVRLVAGILTDAWKKRKRQA